MNETMNARRWIRPVLLVGLFYLIVGLVFAEIDKGAATRFWRWAAWFVSGMAFAAHIGYGRIRLGHPSAIAAFHASLACGLGSFGLAAAALIRALVTGIGKPALLAIALVAWPVITMVPAFLVALAVAAVLGRMRPAAPLA